MSKNIHAQALGKLGGLASAQNLTAEERRQRAAKAGKSAPGWPKGKPRGPRSTWGELNAEEFARLGGHARSAGMTAEARRASASKAGKSAPGWPKGKPRGPRKVA